MNFFKAKQKGTGNTSSAECKYPKTKNNNQNDNNVISDIDFLVVTANIIVVKRISTVHRFTWMLWRLLSRSTPQDNTCFGLLLFRKLPAYKLGHWDTENTFVPLNRFILIYLKSKNYVSLIIIC